MSANKKIEQLASQLLYHKRLYYQGKSILSNEEYDAIEGELEKLNPHHPVLEFVGFDSSNQKLKVQHSIPMLSLTKTYSKSTLLEFLTRYECIAIDKFDGMALSLEYNSNGKLVRASTRGNGTFGEDITEQVFHIIEIPKVLNISQSLQNYKIEVRGEVYFPLSEFKQFSHLFDSFRNAVPGTLGRKDVNDASFILKSFLFCPFDVILFDQNNQAISAEKTAQIFQIEAKYSEKIKFIQNLGFHIHENFIFKFNNKNLNENTLTTIIDTLFTKKRDHEIDGLVFRLEDEKEWELLGNTAHHPRGSLAFKWAGETAITEILSIETNVGRSGKISFRAKLNPVFLSSAKISYATLHNADFIEKGNYAIGAKVKVIRSGEVIPAILTRIDDGQDKYTLPVTCLCESELIRRGPDLWCSNGYDCEYSHQESLVYFVSKMDIYGLSEKLVYRLHDAGLVREAADFYALSIEDLLQLDGFGKKLAQNIVHSIHKEKTIPLWKFLTALGLTGSGEVRCKEVAQKFIHLENVLNLKMDDLLAEKGWAEKSAKDLIDSIHKKNSMIQNILKYIEIAPDHTSSQIKKNSFLSGKKVCITGTLSRPRAEFKALVEQQGAKIVSNISEKTDLLICNEASNSSKYKEAEKLGIPIMTEEEVLTTNNET